MKKYHAKKAEKTEMNGIMFDSVREAARYQVTVNGKRICKYLADFQTFSLWTWRQAW